MSVIENLITGEKEAGRGAEEEEGSRGGGGGGQEEGRGRQACAERERE